MKLLLQSIKKYKLNLILLICVVILQILFQVVITGYVSNMVDTVMNSITEGYDAKSLNGLLISRSIFLTVLAILMAVFSVLAGLISSRISSNIGRDLRGRVYHKVMSFSLPEVDKFSISTLITRSTTDVQLIQTNMFTFLSTALLAPVIAVVGFVCVFRYKSGMEWIIGISVFVVLASMFIIFKMIMPYARRLSPLVDKVNRVYREYLTGLFVIRAFGREKWSTDRCHEVNSEYRGVSMATGRVLQMMMPVFNLINNITTVVIVFVGAYKVSEGIIEVGVMMAFISYVQMIVLGFMLLASMAMQFPRTVMAAQRISDVLNTECSIENGVDALFENSEDESIELSNVSYRYTEDGGYVLKDISFKANIGETTAIIGNTGSGKTTLLRLLLRLYDVTEGSIKVFGKNIKSLDINEYRANIGYVPQNNYLFSGTIESNIKLGDSEASMDDVKNASLIASADEFISKKENSYKELVSQGGGNFSGGQRQRLAIARSVIRNPKIYLFDDSFSALDFKTDAAIRKELLKFKQDSITIVVAQRISSIMNADQILVLENGRIVGKGKHSELIKECEVYREIARSQMSDEEYNNSLG